MLKWHGQEQNRKVNSSLAYSDTAISDSDIPAKAAVVPSLAALTPISTTLSKLPTLAGSVQHLSVGRCLGEFQETPSLATGHGQQRAL
jgi:hypothetical protein